MDWITDLLENRVLISAVTGWFIAQLIKTILFLVINREFRLERMVGSGGMPSSHAATVCAMVVATVFNFGFSSFEFAIAFLLMVIVLHDATGVRLETGRQAQILNKIISQLQAGDNSVFHGAELKELIGHTPIQVCAGSIIGIITGLIIN